MKTIRKLFLGTAALVLSASAASPAFAIKTEGLPPKGPIEKPAKGPVEKPAKGPVEKAPAEKPAKEVAEKPARELKMADLKPGKIEVEPRTVEPVRKELPFKAEVTPSGGVKVDKVVGDAGLKAEGLKNAKPGESGGVISVTYPLDNK